ncbi:MAG: hypothetical protein M3Q10_07050 [Chloroflexota bacterium]|nr:hypothetical protein [Chloroflexota bacterium]
MTTATRFAFGTPRRQKRGVGIVARLGPSGREVLCGSKMEDGRPTCGGKLADWLPGSPDQLLLDPAGEHGTIVLNPGWHKNEDGVWTHTKHARERFHQDRTVASGNSLAERHLSHEARERLKTHRSARYRRGAHRKRRQATHHPRSVFEAQCPECPAINRVDRSVLCEETARRRQRHPKYADFVAAWAEGRNRKVEPLPPLDEDALALLPPEERLRARVAWQQQALGVGSDEDREARTRLRALAEEIAGHVAKTRT